MVDSLFAEGAKPQLCVSRLVFPLPSPPCSFFIVLTNVFGIFAALHSDWRTGAYVVQVRRVPVSVANLTREHTQSQTSTRTHRHTRTSAHQWTVHLASTHFPGVVELCVDPGVGTADRQCLLALHVQGAAGGAGGGRHCLGCLGLWRPVPNPVKVPGR